MTKITTTTTDNDAIVAEKPTKTPKAKAKAEGKPAGKAKAKPGPKPKGETAEESEKKRIAFFLKLAKDYDLSYPELDVVNVSESEIGTIAKEMHEDAIVKLIESGHDKPAIISKMRDHRDNVDNFLREVEKQEKKPKKKHKMVRPVRMMKVVVVRTRTPRMAMPGQLVLLLVRIAKGWTLFRVLGVGR